MNNVLSGVSDALHGDLVTNNEVAANIDANILSHTLSTRRAVLGGVTATATLPICASAHLSALVDSSGTLARCSGRSGSSEMIVNQAVMRVGFSRA